MGKFDRYAFSAQPSFDEAATRKAFSKAIPLKTLVIYCYDPRAAEICISDYEASLKHDTALVRSHGGTPKNVNVFGFFYDIDTGTLTEVVRDVRRA